MVTTPRFTDTTWKVASTLNIAGDPNGDILWQNVADQSLVLWQQNGTTTVAITELPSIDGFDVVAAGDTDGDGLADPFLRNGTTGANKILLSSTGALTDTSPNPTVPGSWYVAAMSDTTKDGRADVFWFDTNTATLAVWGMGGANVSSGATSFNSTYAGSDLFLSAYDGTSLNSFRSLWFDTSDNEFELTQYIGGAVSAVDAFTVETGNAFAGRGDYDGDGQTDFLFRDNTGADAGSVEVVFTSFGSDVARVTFEAPDFPGLRFETGGDFDDDGVAELLARDEVSGALSLYQVIGGSASSQTLLGSDTNDLIDGQAGNDQLFAGAGDDIAIGGDGDDLLILGDGNDRARGGGDSDSLFGGNGADELEGDAGNDDIFGGQGDDILRAGNGTDILEGGEGEDFLRAGSFGFDHMRGGPGDDIIQGIGDRSAMEGNDGNDALFGGSSLDVMFGGDGNDFLVGNLSLDTIFGGAGDDVIIGVDRDGTSGTDDIAYGGSGTDYFYLGNDDGNYYVGSGEMTIKDFSTSATFGDFVMLNGTSGNYDFVDVGAAIEIRQSTDADVLAIIETVATAADVESRAIFIG